MIRRLWWIALLALPVTLPFWAQNEADIYQDVAPAVVLIEVPDGHGSGLVIDAEGHIVTNAHVLGIWRGAHILFKDGMRKFSSLVGIDRRYDIAILKVDTLPSEVTPVSWGDSASLVVGEPVLTIGAPRGLEWSVTRGIVSGLGRESLGLTGLIQTDAAVAGGSSGGPLLNQMGDVIGVVVSGFTVDDLNFAIPSNLAASLAATMIASPIPTPEPMPTATPIPTPIPSFLPSPLPQLLIPWDVPDTDDYTIPDTHIQRQTETGCKVTHMLRPPTNERIDLYLVLFFDQRDDSLFVSEIRGELAYEAETWGHNEGILDWDADTREYGGYLVDEGEYLLQVAARGAVEYARFQLTEQSDNLIWVDCGNT